WEVVLSLDWPPAGSTGRLSRAARLLILAKNVLRFICWSPFCRRLPLDELPHWLLIIAHWLLIIALFGYRLFTAKLRSRPIPTSTKRDYTFSALEKRLPKRSFARLYAP